MYPVSIVTGFLGSGKTTLINRLVSHASLRDCLVVVNEIGEIGIDHLLVSAPADNLRLLQNGCLCCEMRGELVETLVDALRRRATGEVPPFGRVIVETTGLADPVPAVRSIVGDEALRALCRLDAVIGVVDAVHALGQIASQPEARKQVAVADVVALTKVDLVDTDWRREVEAAVRSINPGAAIFPACHGDVEPARLLDRRAGDEADLARWLGDEEAGSPDAALASRPRHCGDVRTFTIAHEGRVSPAALATWLGMLASFHGPRLLRVKGIVGVDGEPHVVHVVQSVVHPPVPLGRWPRDDCRSRIVFVVRGLDRTDLERTFTALASPPPRATAPGFDPAAYARFRATAKRFVGSGCLEWERAR